MLQDGAAVRDKQERIHHRWYHHKLMATNDPLEAFGNAKTINNDNSSRFAKCIQMFSTQKAG